MEKEKLSVEPEASQEKNLAVEPTHRIRFECYRLLIHAPTTQLKNETFKNNIITQILVELNEKSGQTWKLENGDIKEDGEWSHLSFFLDLQDSVAIVVKDAFNNAHEINETTYTDAEVVAEPLFQLEVQPPDEALITALQNNLQSLIKLDKHKENICCWTDESPAPNEVITVKLEKVKEDNSQSESDTSNVRWPLQRLRIVNKEGKRIIKETGGGIVVAHPDTGITKHPLLNGKISDDNIDYHGNNSNAQAGEKGRWTHGTATGSLIVGDIVGVAPGAKLLPIRTNEDVIYLTLTSWKNLIKGIEYAKGKKCNIISMSLGGLLVSPSLERSIDEAIEDGIIVICAAGNKWPFVVYPAKYRNVIAVSACTIEERLCDWSARGDCVAVSAFGEDVWRASWDNSTAVLKKSWGTSYATALVAGVCALWLEKNKEKLKDFPKSRYAQIFKAIVSDPTNSISLKEDKKYQHIKRNQFGSGRINVNRVLDAKLPKQFKNKPYIPPKKQLKTMKTVNITHCLDKENYGEEWMEVFEYLELRLEPSIQHELVTHIIASNAVSDVLSATYTNFDSRKTALIDALTSVSSTIAAQRLTDIKGEIEEAVNINGPVNEAYNAIKTSGETRQWMMLKYNGFNRFNFTETGYNEEFHELLSANECGLVIVVTPSKVTPTLYSGPQVSQAKLQVVKRYAEIVINQLGIETKLQVEELQPQILIENSI